MIFPLAPGAFWIKICLNFTITVWKLGPNFMSSHSDLHGDHIFPEMPSLVEHGHPGFLEFTGNLEKLLRKAGWQGKFGALPGGELHYTFSPDPLFRKSQLGYREFGALELSNLREGLEKYAEKNGWKCEFVSRKGDVLACTFSPIKSHQQVKPHLEPPKRTIQKGVPPSRGAAPKPVGPINRVVLPRTAGEQSISTVDEFFKRLERYSSKARYSEQDVDELVAAIQSLSLSSAENFGSFYRNLLTSWNGLWEEWWKDRKNITPADALPAESNELLKAVWEKYPKKHEGSFSKKEPSVTAPKTPTPSASPAAELKRPVFKIPETLLGSVHIQRLEAVVSEIQAFVRERNEVLKQDAHRPILERLKETIKKLQALIDGRQAVNEWELPNALQQAKALLDLARFQLPRQPQKKPLDPRGSAAGLNLGQNRRAPPPASKDVRAEASKTSSRFVNLPPANPKKSR